MSATSEQLLNAALALPDEDRLGLAEALLDSVPPMARPELHESWRELVRQRSSELASGAVTPIPWEDVEKRIDAGEAAGG